MRRSLATPCPVPIGSFANFDDTYNEDTSTEFEYTTAFQASFRNVKPKRAGFARRGNSNFVIHEDGNDEAQRTGVNEGAQKVTASSGLVKPARRVATQTREPINSLEPVLKAEVQRYNGKQPQRACRAARRSCLPSSRTSEEVVRQEDAVDGIPEPRRIAVERHVARRKTLYIPSEDTTQPKMWMGAFFSVENGPEEEQIELTGIAARMAEKAKKQASNFAKPRRAPMKQIRAAQEESDRVDRAGAPTGKENIPPLHTRDSKEGEAVTQLQSHDAPNNKDLQRKKFISQARLEKLSETGSHMQCSSVNMMYEVGRRRHEYQQSPRTRAVRKSGPTTLERRGQESLYEDVLDTAACDGNQGPAATSALTNVDEVLQPMLEDNVEVNSRTPLLDHVEHSTTCKELWQEPQDVAASRATTKLTEEFATLDHDMLRSQLLKRYQSPETNLLQSHVQAALLYGTLSLSYESILWIHNITRDVELKRQFLGFWLDNYDNDLLEAAVVVMAERQPYAPANRACESIPLLLDRRRMLSNFIDSYLLRHEEPHFKSAGTGVSCNDLGSKTILKSLMLVKALDMSKEGPRSITGNQLFHQHANLKSSAEAVQSLMKLLNPAVQNPVRALKQLGYQVTHEQQEADEVSY
ncbi:hypothetical protein LTR05_004264 [Lithohypha guttulata]|uniref:Uncharacterized protein n=1 Tax=Lithohypha guttulata TaxID=1690604 RepID=A0AAN7T206_9EURO|nr:hypothetical protein LTR05_004264 [Lithohypha guttulata]